MRKPVYLGLALLWGSWGVDAAPPAEVTPPSLSVWLTHAPAPHDSINDTVYQMLSEAGSTEGFRGGKAQRAWELRQSLSKQAAQFNRLYLFAPLIQRAGWLPPVIADATSMASITDRQMRTAHHIYNILVPERFVSNPPSWHQYLFAGLAVNATPGTDVMPRNRAERQSGRPPSGKAGKPAVRALTTRWRPILTA